MVENGALTNAPQGTATSVAGAIGSGSVAKASRKNDWGQWRRRRHQPCPGVVARGPQNFRGGSTSSWGHMKTQARSHGGRFSCSRGHPQLWTSMRDTCETSGKDRYAPQGTPPLKSSKTTTASFSGVNSPPRTCQAISACRMLEEMGIANTFVPGAVWRAVRAKDRCGKFRARGWGSLAAVWTMAQAAELDEDLLVCTSSILATTFCLRISESASIRVQDLDPTAATISYFDKKTRRCWITRPASTYVVRLMGFARAAALRLGRKPFQPLVKGGAKVLQASLVRLLGAGQYDHLRWHCWRRLGATLLIRHGATVQELLAWGRWRSVKSARRYVATWEDRPWTNEHLPRPALVEGKVGQWQFIKGTARTARSLWPMSLSAGRQLDGWRSDGSDADNGAHLEALGTIDPPNGAEGEAATKRTQVEPTTSGPGLSTEKDGPGRPPAVGAITSPSKRIPKRARVSLGATHVEVTAKIGHLAAMARRAAKSTTVG